MQRYRYALTAFLTLLSAGVIAPSVCKAQAPSPAAPALLVMCEDTDGCSRWQFQGTHATGSWASGALGNLTLDQFDGPEKGTVSIHRLDSAGAYQGLTATYTGTRSGPIIDGNVRWKWPGHPDGETHWRGLILRDIVNLVPTAAHPVNEIPASLTACEDGGGCGRWDLHGNTGVINGGTQVLANLKVERFDDHLVAIRRYELSGTLKGLEALYVGVPTGHTIEGLVTFKWSGQPPEGVHRWSATLTPPAAQPQPAPPAPAYLPIEKLADLVLPDRTPKLQAPPDAPWHQHSALASFDLSGEWRREDSPAAHPERVLAYQLRDHLLLAHLEGMQHFGDHTPLADVTFTSPTVASGFFHYASTEPKLVELDATFTALDANHFQVKVNFGTQKDTIFQSWRYVRVSLLPAPDVPCDATNSHHIAVDQTTQRGDIYLKDNELAIANCWYYVGALGGNTDGLAEYGKSIYTGRGIAQNQAIGIARIQEAAVQGSSRASRFLAELFEANAGLPRSQQRHDYWLARYFGTSPDLVHEQQIYRAWYWMIENAKPCDALNPQHVNAEDAFKMGRVAYEARLFPLAHCWMRISAAQGKVKAWTYLGLMSAFGMGVQPNLKNAFSYMYHAAHDDDAYAMVYLANFYRYGVGVPADDQQGRAVMQEAVNIRGGDDAFADVEGTSVTPTQAMSMTVNIFEAAVVQESDCPSDPIVSYEMRGGKKVQVTKPRPPCNSPRSDAIMDRINAAPKSTLGSPEELFPEHRLPIF